MPRKRFATDQIAVVSRQAEVGTTIEEICRKMGVSEPTLYRWNKQIVGLGVSEIRCLKQLQDENIELKWLVADLSLNRTMLAGSCASNPRVASAKMVRTAFRRDVAGNRRST